MKKVLSALLAMTMIFTLSACSDGGEKTKKVTLNVYNWGEYIDEDVLGIFEEETGITVNYQLFQNNEEMYAKIKSGSASYDVIIPSDYMIHRMITEDMLEPLDFANIPNFDKIDEKYKNPEYDETGAYSVPYTWGTVGIIYNKDVIPNPEKSWNILWDPAYSGQIIMFNNPRDAIGIALKKLGYSLNTTDEGQLREAAKALIEQKPVVQAYYMDQIFNKLPSEEALVAPYYAGDAMTMIDENPSLAFFVPEEGTNRFVDALCIPKGAANKKEAEAFINFMTRPDIAQKNIEYISYSTPLPAVYENLDEAAKSEIAYPSDAVLAKSESFQNLPEETLALYDALWIEIFK